MPRPKLTRKQAAFIREYLVDLNASAAARRAGYSPRTAGVIGRENLQKPVIAAAILAAQSARAVRTEITQDWVLRSLFENVERAMQAEPVRDREGNETGEYVYQGSVANRALELLGKHLGMFVERHEHAGPEGGPLTIAVTRTVVPVSHRISGHLAGVTNGDRRS